MICASWLLHHDVRPDKVEIGASEGGLSPCGSPSHATVVEVVADRDHAARLDPEFEALEIVKTRAAFGNLGCGHGTIWLTVGLAEVFKNSFWP